MNWHCSARTFLGLIVATILAFASLSVATSPANGDANEGGTLINPASRAQSAKISAGAHHTCAIIGTTSTVWCWGDNSLGQLGDGTRVSSTTPVQVAGLTGATAVAVGDNHTCALLAGGVAKCWGGAGFGQLGTGSTPAYSTTPVTVVDGHVFTTISAGTHFTCGTTAAQLFCWGRNNRGQLGDGLQVAEASPTLANLPGTPRVVSTGQLHACAVVVGGNAYCWGDNVQGQLGIGVFDNVYPDPQLVSTVNVDAITVGAAHTCALTAGGTKCWGLGFNGQLGNGGTSSLSVPTNTSNGNTTEQAISAGTYHTCARITAQLRCWGQGTEGQLGNGTGASTNVPLVVPGYSSAGNPTISVGDFHTCVQFQAGMVDCFGANTDGQLGNGTHTSSATPVRALGLPGVPGDGSAGPGSAEGSLEVTFSAPANTGGTPLKNYRIRDLDGSLDVLVPGNTTSHTLTGLTAGNAYRLAVSAVSEVGEGQPVELAPVTLSSLPYLKVNDVTVVEGNSGSKTLTFTVTRFGKTTTAVSVKAATHDGDANVPAAATAPSDYTAKAATAISFAAGQTTKTFAVTTKGDLLTELNESFYVNLSAPVGAVISDGTGIGTLTNDDVGTLPAYAIGNSSLVEGNSGTTNMSFTINRTGSTAVAGSVKYSTTAIVGGATSGTDFTAKTPTLVSFPVGVTNKFVTVAIKGDLVGEPDEDFRVVLTSPVNGDLPAQPFANGKILNDDSNAAPTVAINDIAFDEGNGFSKTVTFTVTRSGNLAGTTTVKYLTQNGTAIAPGDYGAKALTSLSFTPGQSTKAVTISVKSDKVAEPDEIFFVVLSAPTGGTITDPSGSANIVNDD